MISQFLKNEDVEFVLYRHDVDGSIIFVGVSLNDGSVVWTGNIEYAEKYDSYISADSEAKINQCKVGYLIKL